MPNRKGKFTEVELTAYHEAGHAVISVLLEAQSPHFEKSMPKFEEVTIEPTAKSRGSSTVSISVDAFVDALLTARHLTAGRVVLENKILAVFAGEITQMLRLKASPDKEQKSEADLMDKAFREWSDIVVDDEKFKNLDLILSQTYGTSHNSRGSGCVHKGVPKDVAGKRVCEFGENQQ
jgi:hypothetical protein